MARFDYAWALNDADTADCEVIIGGPSALGEGSDVACGVVEHSKRFQAHRVLLAAAGGYFKAAVKPTWLHAGPHLPQIIITVPTTKDLDIGELLVRFIYEHRLPNDISFASLLTLLVLADQYQSSVLVATCAEKLECFRPEQLSWDDCLSVLNSPTEACGEKLTANVQQRVFELFSDLDKAWTTPDLHSKLLQLPYNALLTLITSRVLRVVAENTVVVVLEAWLQEGAGQGCTPEQIGLLTQAVQLANLGPGLLKCIANGAFPAFSRGFTPTQAATLLYSQAIRGIMRLPTAPLRDLLQNPRNPSKVDEVMLVWSLNKDQLHASASKSTEPGEAFTMSPSCFYGGYLWQMGLVVNEQGRVQCGIRGSIPSLRQAPPPELDNTHIFVTASVTMHTTCRPFIQNLHKLEDSAVPLGTFKYSAVQLPAVADPGTFAENWGQYLVNGQVTWRMRISACW